MKRFGAFLIACALVISSITVYAKEPGEYVEFDYNTGTATRIGLR